MPRPIIIACAVAFLSAGCSTTDKVIANFLSSEQAGQFATEQTITEITSTGRAPDFMTLGSGMQQFQCISAGGEASRFVLQAPAAIISIEGEMRLNTVDRTAREWPMAKVVLASADTEDGEIGFRLNYLGNSQNWLTEDELQLIQDNPAPLRLRRQRTSYSASLLKQGRVAAMGSIRKTETVPFKLEFPSSDSAVFTIGRRGISRRYPVNGGFSHLHLSCRGAWAEFTIKKVITENTY